MFFTVNNSKYTPIEYLRTSTLLKAYYIIKKYPIGATEMLLEQYLQQQYKVSLKDMCIKLLLKLSYYEDDHGNLVFLFKDHKYDQIARLITYGNGVIHGSKILQAALKN